MRKEFYYVNKNKDSQYLIVFIHGLGGSHKTWINQTSLTILDYLVCEKNIVNNFDIALYNYKSSIFNVYSNITYLKSFIIGKNDQMIEIEKVVEILHNFLTTNDTKNQKIIFISHSLGTIITKHYLLRYNNEYGYKKKYVLFFSFASPFWGSKFAKIHKFILGIFKRHKQIHLLEPNSKYLQGINKQWITLTGAPDTFQFVALNDQVIVNKDSEYPKNIWHETIIRTSDDHFTIIQPQINNAHEAISKINDKLTALYNELNGTNSEFKINIVETHKKLRFINYKKRVWWYINIMCVLVKIFCIIFVIAIAIYFILEYFGVVGPSLINDFTDLLFKQKNYLP